MKLNILFLISAVLFSSTAWAELKDPTIPLALISDGKTPVHRVDKLTLKAIVLSQKPSAVINNQHVFIGDVIQGMVVLSIRDNEVKLINSSGTELRLFLYTKVKHFSNDSQSRGIS